MNSPKFVQKLIVVILAIVFLIACGAPAATPTLSSTFPPTPPPPPGQPQPSLSQPGQPPQPFQPTGQSSLFKFIKTVQVTRVGNYTGGAFGRIGYVPAKDRMIVTFDVTLGQQEGDCKAGGGIGEGGYAYREYTPDMAATGNQGLLSCNGGTMDSGGLFVGNGFYVAFQAANNTTHEEGWTLIKYNAVTWESLASTFYPLNKLDEPGNSNQHTPKRDAGDPMLAMVNGQIDVSSTYRSDPTAPGGPLVSYTTHHQLFTPDLQWVRELVLSETPHINLSSMIAANGVTDFVTGTAILGDMIVMQYDSNWNYLGTKTLKQKSSAPEGLAFDGKRFYVSYLDVPCESYPCSDNVRLAAFDTNWNLLDDIAVTSYPSQDKMIPNRPSLALWNGRLFVVYDIAENPNATGPEDADLQVYVKVYELTPKP